MSDRPHYRGGGRGGSGPRGGGHRGGGRGGGGAAGGDKERPKKENILDLSKYMDKEICVKFNGGREGTSPRPPPPSPLASCAPADICATVKGILKGFDALMNLVLDDGKETLRGLWFLCPARSIGRFGLTGRGRRGGQRRNETSGPRSRKRHAACAHQPRRRQRGDREPLRPGGGRLNERNTMLYDKIHLSSRPICTLRRMRLMDKRSGLTSEGQQDI